MAKNIYVGNLAWAVTDDDLRELFSQFGAVKSAQVIQDKETGRSRGFGFVEMPDDTEAAKAIAELNGRDSGGRPLTVNEARPKVDRDRPRGGGGGGGRDSRGGGGGRDGGGNRSRGREPRW